MRIKLTACLIAFLVLNTPGVAQTRNPKSITSASTKPALTSTQPVVEVLDKGRTKTERLCGCTHQRTRKESLK